MFTLRETGLPGCFEVLPRQISDVRGRFIKTFHAPSYSQLGLETEFVEEYYTTSHRGVLRGLHFQIPPADHAKLVYCVAGSVFDAVLDLRKDSPTYGRFAHLELSEEKRNLLYVPRGIAHGFTTISDECTMIYKVTSVHSPAEDAGIHWDSAGIPWPGSNFIISERDQSFPGLSQYNSPFRMKQV
jgi:dTDP-4-dehydrorhamnose 3,5-epimerase